MSYKQNLSEIKKKYRAKAADPDQLFLLEPDIALQYIDDCITAGCRVEGVEGFFITKEDAFQPSQEHSNDIADTGLDYDTFVEETKKFIRERLGTGVRFEVVISPEK